MGPKKKPKKVAQKKLPVKHIPLEVGQAVKLEPQELENEIVDNSSIDGSSIQPLEESRNSLHPSLEEDQAVLTDETILSLSSEGSHSHSNPEDMRVVAIHAHWTIREDKWSIFGHVVLDIEQLNSKSKELKLDSEGLFITSVKDMTTDQPLLSKEEGSALTIDLTESLVESRKCSVKIKYEKTDEVGMVARSRFNEELGMLTAQEKKEKVYPVYSQFGIVHGRNLFPCQDTPSNKIQFSAVVHIHRSLQLLLSARLLKSSQDSDGLNELHYAHLEATPVFNIGLTIGKFKVHHVADNVKVYAEQEVHPEYMYQLSLVPAYIKLFNNHVGLDAWGQHNIVLLSQDSQTHTYPYLYVFPKDNLDAITILYSLSHNWFRNVVPSRYIDDMWLNEALSIHISRKLAALVGQDQEVEKFICDAAEHLRKQSQHKDIPLVFLIRSFFKPDAFKLTIEKAYMCLLVLEHYGGRYGEFETLVKCYYDENKFNLVGVDTFTTLAQRFLVFQAPCENESSAAVEALSDVRKWIDNGAAIPAEFYKKIIKEFDIMDVVEWLVEENERETEQHDSNEDEGDNLRTDDKVFYFCDTSDTEDTASDLVCNVVSDESIGQPLLHLTAEYVNHRTRKYLLLKILRNLMGSKTENFNKEKRLKHKILNELDKTLGLNCAQDEMIKFEFVMLSIAHQWLSQLKQIRQFVSRCVQIEQLTDIMHGLLLWQNESDQHTNISDYKYTPMRRQVIELCDTRLEELISAEENQLQKRKKLMT